MASEGMSLNLAKQNAKLADVYFGSGDSIRVQRESMVFAEQRGLSVAHLLMIEKHAIRSPNAEAPGSCVPSPSPLKVASKKLTPTAHNASRKSRAKSPKKQESALAAQKNGVRTVTITDDQRNITT